MPRVKMGMQLCAVGIAVAILFSAVGCSDDECPVTPVTYDSPAGGWNVASTNQNLTILDTTIPPIVIPNPIPGFPPIVIDVVGTFVQPWLEETLFPDASEWSVGVAGYIFTRMETTACLPMGYEYDYATRSCTETSDFDLQEQDVAEHDFCESFDFVVATATVCVLAVSVDAEVTPDITWSEDFKSFEGDEAIGSQVNPATVSFYLDVTPDTQYLPDNWYTIVLYGGRDFTATRCDGCTPCRE